MAVYMCVCGYVFDPFNPSNHPREMTRDFLVTPGPGRKHVYFYKRFNPFEKNVG